MFYKYSGASIDMGHTLDQGNIVPNRSVTSTEAGVW